MLQDSPFPPLSSWPFCPRLVDTLSTAAETRQVSAASQASGLFPSNYRVSLYGGEQPGSHGEAQQGQIGPT